MSFFVDEAIKMWRRKEAKLTETTKQCKYILRSMKTLVKHNRETDRSTSVCVKDEDIPVKEQQEIALLEQVLKKALKVRSSSALPKNHGSDLQEKNPSKNSSARNSPVPVGTTVKEAVEMNPPKKTLSTELQWRHLQPVLSKRGSLSQPAIRGKLLVTKPAPVQNVDVQKSSSLWTTCSKDSNKEKSIDLKELRSSQISPLEEQMVLSPLLPVWQVQRAKKNRLWNKVLTRHSKPGLEQARFRERLISTIWPSGQVAVRGAELDNLTLLGLDLTHCYRAELLGQQPFSACGMGEDPEISVEREYESLLMLQGLEKMMVKVIKEGDCLKKEWERKVGTPPCPLRKRSERGESVQSCLPLIMFYSTEAEFEELDRLRLQVDQLKLEIRLHQAISDLTHHLTPKQSISEWPCATSLRGLYSLLGEGGAHFPTLVLDSEPH
ncbi:uncharacterized protein tedc2 [Salminus brasiliensis]|uniref:uncharacterized protein tedc2 n=1 Tax=Salminus brasiliensis TaxID=930266 RepID=UPI003B838034